MPSISVYLLYSERDGVDGGGVMQVANIISIVGGV